MRAEYHEIYERLYQNPRNLLDPKVVEELTQTLKKFIDNAEGAENTKLRPDAKWFLLLNTRGMIAAPVYLGADEPLKRGILEILHGDIRTIVRRAREVTQKRADAGDQDGGETSGHDVIVAINDVWKKLGSGISNVWS